MTASLAPTGAVRAAEDAHPRRWWVLAALCLSLLVVGLDATVLNVALSHISLALDASTTDLQWIVNGYLLTFAVLLIPAGVLGDRVGRGKVLAAGLGVFVTASAVAAWSTSPGALVAARTLMGVGAAAVFPLALSILPTVFPRDERGKAVAVATAAMGIGMPLGPLVAGWLLDHFWWGSTLLINVPIVAVALVAGLVLIPDSRDPSPQPLDVPGLALSAVGIAALVYAVIQAPVHGWSDPTVVGPLGAAAILLAAFAVVERRAAAPLADRQLVTAPLFLWPTLATALVSFVMLGLVFVVPLYLQAVRGDSALQTGLELMPVMLALVLGAGIGAAAQARAGLRTLVCGGLLVTAGGFVLMLRVTPTSGYPTLMWALILVGLGFGIAMPAATDAVLGALPAGRESTGTALDQVVKQLGGAFGVAVLGNLVAAAYRSGMREASAALPAPAADIARDSVSGASAIAARLGGPVGEQLHAAAGAAYVSGMQHASIACALAAGASAVLLACVLPRRDQTATPATPDAADVTVLQP